MAYKNPRTADISPASSGAAVAPDNSNDLSAPTKAVYIGGDGNLKVTLTDDADNAPITFVGLTAGIVLPIKAKRIWATGTTATNILALR